LLDGGRQAVRLILVRLSTKRVYGRAVALPFRLDARIDSARHRDSDLLAFQIGIERGNPGSLMCAYNKVNGAYACGNEPMLDGDVKKAIGFKGFIMSDWRAVYGWDNALKGLDMQSGAQLDEQDTL
jgi:beta-glucosidase